MVRSWIALLRRAPVFCRPNTVRYALAAGKAMKALASTRADPAAFSSETMSGRMRPARAARVFGGTTSIPTSPS